MKLTNESKPTTSLEDNASQPAAETTATRGLMHAVGPSREEMHLDSVKAQISLSPQQQRTLATVYAKEGPEVVQDLLTSAVREKFGDQSVQLVRVNQQTGELTLYGADEQKFEFYQQTRGSLTSRIRDVSVLVDLQKQVDTTIGNLAEVYRATHLSNRGADAYKFLVGTGYKSEELINRINRAPGFKGGFLKVESINERTGAITFSQSRGRSIAAVDENQRKTAAKKVSALLEQIADQPARGRGAGLFQGVTKAAQSLLKQGGARAYLKGLLEKASGFSFQRLSVRAQGVQYKADKPFTASQEITRSVRHLQMLAKSGVTPTSPHSFSVDRDTSPLQGLLPKNASAEQLTTLAESLTKSFSDPGISVSLKHGRKDSIQISLSHKEGAELVPSGLKLVNRLEMLARRNMDADPIDLSSASFRRARTEPITPVVDIGPDVTQYASNVDATRYELSRAVRRLHPGETLPVFDTATQASFTIDRDDDGVLGIIAHAGPDLTIHLDPLKPEQRTSLLGGELIWARVPNNSTEQQPSRLSHKRVSVFNAPILPLR